MCDVLELKYMCSHQHVEPKEHVSLLAKENARAVRQDIDRSGAGLGVTTDCRARSFVGVFAFRIGDQISRDPHISSISPDPNCFLLLGLFGR